MSELVTILKATADESRLRIVRLLAAESLNVGELTMILGLAQSSVSRHLGELKKAGLVTEQREGGFVYYTMQTETGSPTFAAVTAELTAGDDLHGDTSRLAEVLRARTDRGDASGRVLEPGRSWVAWARSLRFVLPRLRVADFGCGDGALTVEIAAWAKSVLAIECDSKALGRARRRVERAGLDNVRFRQGSIEDGGTPASSVDLVVISHTLHHVEQPSAVLDEAQRVLDVGGRVLVLELAPHQEDWVEQKLGHRWRGFTTGKLEKLMVEAGFAEVEVELTPKQAAPEPFRIVIASGVRG